MAKQRLTVEQLKELKGFIINTNGLYSINNGPFPNTALEISTGIIAKFAGRPFFYDYYF